MRTATVYMTPLRTDVHDREQLIYAEAQRALIAIAEPECRTAPGMEPNVASPLPGLAFVLPQAPVIALGLDAHVALSDVSKRTLIAGDLGLEAATGEDDEQIEQLVWSSVNTTKMVVVGELAWESIQLLPLADRRFHDAPPLPMPQADMEHPSILVVAHEDASARALALVEALEQAALSVECIGLCLRNGPVMQQSPWADTAWIHVHVGEHTLKTEQPRLVDSWHNGRLTIHLLERAGSVRQDASVPTLAVIDQENGLVCSTPREVVAACHDLLSDPVLRHKLVGVGRSSAAPFLKGWQAIAKDLLS